MAFSFNFDIKVKTDESCQGNRTAEKDQEDCLKSVKDEVAPPRLVKAAREHPLPLELPPFLQEVVTESVCVGGLPRLLCLDECVQEHTAEEREEQDEEEILRRREEQRSDLIAGVYEGGLRVWECTYDLLQYLDTGGVDFKGRRVLDLGCGAGLLGVMAMRLGAESVDFQDYNSTVITQLTIPNTLLNLHTHTHTSPNTHTSEEEQQQQQQEEEEEEKEERGRAGGVKIEERGRGDDGERGGKEGDGEKEERGRAGDVKEDKRGTQKRGKGDEGEREERKRQRREEEEEEERGDVCDPPAVSGAPSCRFFSGDWASFLSLLQQDPVAHKYDIILTSETIYNTTCYPTLHQLFSWLLARDGQVLLATKAHYFGVGGGLLLFERFVEERGVFQVMRLLEVDEGLQRHVLALTFKTQHTHMPQDTHTAQDTHRTQDTY
ncbi:hypothetical protein ACEWY4_020874 [Coilia grayii]|uniref:protein-histidine N-methyltransferase n=1 Tax=Coilia grayii TaxID=363190 RepID=A0ABD1J8Q2_9TELE